MALFEQKPDWPHRSLENQATITDLCTRTYVHTHTYVFLHACVGVYGTTCVCFKHVKSPLYIVCQPRGATVYTTIHLLLLLPLPHEERD